MTATSGTALASVKTVPGAVPGVGPSAAPGVRPAVVGKGLRKSAGADKPRAAEMETEAGCETGADEWMGGMGRGGGGGDVRADDDDVDPSSSGLSCGRECGSRYTYAA